MPKQPVKQTRDKWLPIEKLAGMIGASRRLLHLIITRQHRFATLEPAAFRQRHASSGAGKLGYEMPLFATYAFVKAHCPQVKNLTNPAKSKVVKAGLKVAEAEPEIEAHGKAFDSLEEIRQAMLDLGKRTFSEREVNKLERLAAGVRLIDKSLADKAEWMKKTEHYSRCDQIASAWATTMHEQAKPVAVETIAKFKKDTGIDLDGLNVSSRDILAAALCRALNAVMKPKMREVLEQIK